MLAASERSGQSVGNIAFLKNYLERYPQQAKAWMLLAQAQEALGQPRAAAASWEAFEDRVGPTSTTRRQRALLLWRAGARRQALALLEASRPLATRQDQAFWALLGDQAWTLGALQPALAAYRLLHESDRTDLLALERLMLLSHQAGQRQTAVRLAAAGFRQSRQPRFLLFGLDLAFQATRWDEMQELFALASSSEGLFRNDEAYWMLKAHMLVHVGDRPGAIAAYENALVAAPRSTAARLGLLWLRIDLDDRLRLSELLARWEADASEDSAYWGVYGVALMRLQRPREAVVWLERLVRAKPEELPLLLNLADSLREAGREQDAWWLRQYVAAQVRGELHHGQ
jgi:tetratricopeptide (TPR) repeat protein